MSEMTDAQHKDGILWNEAPLPGWFHFCKPQSSAWIGLRRFERCACGAKRLDGRAWFGRSERRRNGARKKDSASKVKVSL